MLKLMYITNQPEVAQIAEAAGVDRIFVDMEFIGKDARQKDLDTVKCHHTVQDVVNVKRAVTKAEVLVRVNPIHDALSDYPPSEEEINAVLAAGADVIMLPFFKTAEEVRSFVRLVNGRTKTMLLLETPEAVECIDEILTVEGVDEVHIGLNDLSLGYGMSFMFELLADGTVERLCLKLRKKGVSYGFGGIATIGRGMLPSEYIIKEHYRLGSTCAILSRSFCDATKIQDLDEIKATFLNGVREIRALERECEQHSKLFFENERDVVRLVDRICKGMSDGNK